MIVVSNLCITKTADIQLTKREIEVLITNISIEIMQLQAHYALPPRHCGQTYRIERIDTLYNLRDKLVAAKEAMMCQEKKLSKK